MACWMDKEIEMKIVLLTDSLGFGGAVVAVKDVDAAAEALNAIMPADIRKKQSQANIQKVKTEYVDSVVLDQYVDVYERVAVQ